MGALRELRLDRRRIEVITRHRLPVLLRRHPVMQRTVDLRDDQEADAALRRRKLPLRDQLRQRPRRLEATGHSHRIVPHSVLIGVRHEDDFFFARPGITPVVL